MSSIRSWSLRVEEVAGPDRRGAVIQQVIGPVDDIADPGELGVVVRQPAVEQPVDRRLIGEQVHEVEATPQGSVHEGDRPVGGVHRADDPQVLRQAERLVGVEEPGLFAAVLEQEVQLAEHLGQVAPVDLVDDQQVGPVRGGQRPVDRPAQWPWSEGEADVSGFGR